MQLEFYSGSISICLQLQLKEKSQKSAWDLFTTAAEGKITKERMGPYTII